MSADRPARRRKGPALWRQLTAIRSGSARPRSRGARETLAPRTADRRPRRAVGLPVLRGRLRPEGLRQGREGRPDRGRPRLADLARAAVPEGRGVARATSTARRARRRSSTAGRTGREWEELDLETAMDMIADRVVATREETWEDDRRRGPAAQPHARHRVPRRRDARHRGELPAQEVLHRRWARCRSRTRPAYDTRSTVPGLGTSFGRGGATTFQQDLQNSDCILIMGSNMAEQHPVGFQWVMEAKERGAKVIHVDPRFTRTSAMADLHVPLRAGHRHRLPRRRSSTTSSRTAASSASTSRTSPTRRVIIKRGVPRHRGARRLLLRLATRTTASTRSSPGATPAPRAS